MDIGQRIISIVLGVLLVLAAIFAVVQTIKIKGLEKEAVAAQTKIEDLNRDMGTLKANQVVLQASLKTSNESINSYKTQEALLTSSAKAALDEAKKSAVAANDAKETISVLRRIGATSCEQVQNLANDIVNIRLGVKP